MSDAEHSTVADMSTDDPKIGEGKVKKKRRRRREIDLVFVSYYIYDFNIFFKNEKIQPVSKISISYRNKLFSIISFN